jgi:lipopolysaccharide transport system permease protein
MANHLVIEAGRTERQYWRDLWRYRELFYFLAWRDFLVRYKQTAVGIAWALIRPLLTMLILTMVCKVSSTMNGNGPVPLELLCAMLPWLFFSTAMSESGNSLVTNSNLVSKIYFPRVVVPASSVITSLVDFVISAAILGVMMAFYRYMPAAQIVFLPVFILMVFAAALGTGLWIAALMVKFRDFRFIVPFIVTFGLYASPVINFTSKFPEVWHHWGLDIPVRLIYSLNPVVGIIDGFRWCIMGGNDQLYLPGLAASVVGVIFLMVSGLWYFRKTERTFADIL